MALNVSYAQTRLAAEIGIGQRTQGRIYRWRWWLGAAFRRIVRTRLQRRHSTSWPQPAVRWSLILREYLSRQFVLDVLSF